MQCTRNRLRGNLEVDTSSRIIFLWKKWWQVFAAYVSSSLVGEMVFPGV